MGACEYCGAAYHQPYDDARAEGAAQERAAIVAWLEKEAKAGPYRHATYGDSCPCCVREQTLEDFAEAIRAGEHGRGGGK